MKVIFCIALLLLSYNLSTAQVGGGSVYSFLRLNMSSDYASLGGFSPSVDIRGANSLFSNPALVDSIDNGAASLNFVSYVAGINYGSATYSGRLSDRWMLSGCAEFVNYGDFDETDESANILGQFSCKDHLFLVSVSRKLSGCLSAGATVKTIFSNLDSYRSSGLAMDFGLLYHNDSQNLSVGLSALDMGMQLTDYSGAGRESLPLDIRLGVSKTLLHAPLRFTMTVHDIQKPKLDDDFLTSLADHIILSMELFPEKAVSIKAGFNFQTHNDLYVSGLTPFPGFSVGIDIRLQRFSVQYSRQCLSPAATANLFTIELFLKRFAVY